MFQMKGNLLPPTILGIVAVGLGVFALLSPNRTEGGIWIYGLIAALFGVYVLCGVIVSRSRRR